MPLTWDVLLRSLREASGLSREGWAVRLGYGRSTVQRWEHGVHVPDAAAEQALLDICRERALFRAYQAGALAGLQVDEETLRRALAGARLQSLSLDFAPTLPRIESNSAALPESFTSFVGRTWEIAEVARLLTAARLLTLTGPGGIGKTRLAVEVARTLAPGFSEGVVFVDLAGVTDSREVLPALARALGLQVRDDDPIERALSDHLRGPRLLLLDNFEQVLEAGPRLLALLSATPELRLLVTSRIALRLSGEQVYAVPPLPLPGTSGGLSLPDVRENPAVRLFVDRVRAVQPDYLLSDEAAVVVAGICRRLDGLPLAIELAAARMRVLSPSALLARLDHRLPLLAAHVAGQPERQHALSATIAWSWDALADGERTLFRRLSVFAGGWTLPAAEAVAGGTSSEVLDGMTALLDHSLIFRTDDDDEPRFDMLATLREFAREKLAEADDDAATSARHAGYVERLVAAAADRAWQSGRVEVELLRPLDAERDNVLAALAWAQNADPELGMRVIGSLSLWFYLRSPREGRQRAETLLLAAGDGCSPTAWARASYTAAVCAVGQLDRAAAVIHLERALPVLRAEGDMRLLPRALSLLAVSLPASQPERALALADEAVGLAREHGSRQELALACHQAALARARVGCEPERARALVLEAEALSAATGADWMGSAADVLLGTLARADGRVEESRRLHAERLEHGTPFTADGGIVELQLLLARQADDSSEVARLRRDALLLARRLGNAALTSRCLIDAAAALVARGQHTQAARLLAAAEPFCDEELSGVLGSSRTEYDAALEAVEAALRSEGMTSAAAGSHPLSLEQSVELALAELEQYDEVSALDECERRAATSGATFG
jgi:predicted ATPase/transcriptional regulator with XRE-family HTH domain